MPKPRDAKDVMDAVGAALAGGTSLDIVGNGTKRGIGQPTGLSDVLDLSALDRITSYEPNELVLTVEAGASLDQVQALLAERHQEFAFEPMRPNALLGTAPGGTIGGMIASGLSGPRRFKAGGVRDHVLGASAVSGFAETFKAGGRVVKNVTGYDVCKVLTGSWGTLAAITEVTLKVMPKAETECIVALGGLDDATASRAMIAALGSPFDVSGAAHLPQSALRSGDGVDGLGGLGDANATLLRIEGIEASVKHRAELVAHLLEPFGTIAILHEGSQAIWSQIRDVAPFAANGRHGAWTVWRIICPASSAAQFGQALVRETGGDLIYDWGGGLIWAALPPASDGYASALRARLKPLGGHAMLFRADEAIRRRVDVFEPQPSSLAALEQRLRLSFDPKSVFNPARIVRSPVGRQSEHGRV